MNGLDNWSDHQLESNNSKLDLYVYGLITDLITVAYCHPEIRRMEYSLISVAVSKRTEMLHNPHWLLFFSFFSEGFIV